MYKWRGIVRAIAAIVIIASACDYCEFDRFDPSAPVNHASPGDLMAIATAPVGPSDLVSTDQTDDCCLWCSPAVLPDRAISLDFDQMSWSLLAFSPSAPSNQPQRLERPPRP